MSTLLNNVIENVKPAFCCDGGSEETYEDFCERVITPGTREHRLAMAIQLIHETEEIAVYSNFVHKDRVVIDFYDEDNLSERAIENMHKIEAFLECSLEWDSMFQDYRYGDPLKSVYEYAKKCYEIFKKFSK